jgi:hypothetical protein
MKSFSINTSPDNFQVTLEGLKDKSPSLIFIFSSREFLLSDDYKKAIQNADIDSEILGCSTSGEINDGVFDESVSIMALSFDTTKFVVKQVDIDDSANSKQAGADLASQLAGDNLKGVFLLLPGVNINGSQFVQGVKSSLDTKISISGGLAGDGLNFAQTVTVHNDNPYKNKALGVGFYGDNITITNRAGGGWKPFGPSRRVTRAENNILYELDGQPALDLYKKYLGDKAAELPSSGLLYPFAILDSEDQKETGLIRTILDINEEEGSLILAGDMRDGEKVCLMHASTDQLLSGVENVIDELGDDGQDCAILCVSCVGRKILMGEDTEDELEAIWDKFGEDVPMAGFYSYGEISHFVVSNEVELHNQTLTITCISEKAG